MSFKQILKYSFLPQLRSRSLLFGWIQLPTDPPSQYFALRTLKSLGFTPNTAIDIGAYHGSWSNEYLRIFPETENILLIEPNPKSYSTLAKRLRSKRYPLRNLHVLDVALGTEAQGARPFFAMETGSSFYSELSPYSREQITVNTDSLDHVTDASVFSAADIIKIDTQGSELEILKGALNVLKTVSVIQIEVSLVLSNEGGVLYREIVDFLHRLDFVLFDVNQLIRRKDGVLWQLDLTFCSATLMDKIRLPDLDSSNWY